MIIDAGSRLVGVASLINWLIPTILSLHNAIPRTCHNMSPEQISTSRTMLAQSKQDVWYVVPDYYTELIRAGADENL